LPTTSLHGDLKLDNLGLDHEGVLWLIDWALAVRGPVCVELGWFIAANSQRLALAPQGVVDLHANVAAIEADLRCRHQAMTALCGLLLRGWRKALDAEAGKGRAEFDWWCDAAAEAARFI
jgi:aminoglycoside phosphotransferase (APT) family kinase protein